MEVCGIFTSSFRRECVVCTKYAQYYYYNRIIWCFEQKKWMRRTLLRAYSFVISGKNYCSDVVHTYTSFHSIKYKTIEPKNELMRTQYLSVVRLLLLCCAHEWVELLFSSHVFCGTAFISFFVQRKIFPMKLIVFPIILSLCLSLALSRFV